jgi:hypothetical protein
LLPDPALTRAQFVAVQKAERAGRRQQLSSFDWACGRPTEHVDALAADDEAGACSRFGAALDRDLDPVEAAGAVALGRGGVEDEQRLLTAKQWRGRLLQVGPAIEAALLPSQRRSPLRSTTSVRGER